MILGKPEENEGKMYKWKKLYQTLGKKKSTKKVHHRA
jgi:hypothetical protein